MTSHQALPRSGKDRKNRYDEVTIKIIGELEIGRVPWVQPLRDSGGEATARHAHRCQHGSRLLRHQCPDPLGTVVEHGFSAQNWLTFRQALSLGWQCSQRRTLHEARLCRSLRSQRRESARLRDGA